MEQVDVIIVGAGMAGLCAAVQASEQGATVAVFEKEAAIGGSSLLSGCFMAFAETDFQKQRGITDSVESLMNDLTTVGQSQNEAALVEAYGAHQLETYEWLVSKGVTFHTCQAASGHSVPRGHTITPQQAITTLYNEALANGAKISLNHTVERLLIEQQAVVGVVVEGQAYYANKGVILTTGGFSQSEELLHSFAPQLDQTIRLGGVGNKGDGIKLAAAAGAWLRDFPYIKGTYGFHPSSTNEKKRQAHAFYKGGIIINSAGKRFINESVSYKLLGDAALAEQGATYQVFDQTVMEQSVAGDALYDFKLLYEEGLIQKADTLVQVSALTQAPPEAVAATIQRYNDQLEDARDAFGRTTLTHHFGTPHALQAPFYVMETVTAMLATYAGVSVNPKAQVLNPYGEPIAHLYAAGEVVGGFHGAGYMTGSSLGKAAIFGRVAANELLTVAQEVI